MPFALKKSTFSWCFYCFNCLHTSVACSALQYKHVLMVVVVFVRLVVFGVGVWTSPDVIVAKLLLLCGCPDLKPLALGFPFLSSFDDFGTTSCMLPKRGSAAMFACFSMKSTNCLNLALPSGALTVRLSNTSPFLSKFEGEFRNDHFHVWRIVHVFKCINVNHCIMTTPQKVHTPEVPFCLPFWEWPSSVPFLGTLKR